MSIKALDYIKKNKNKIVKIVSVVLFIAVLVWLTFQFAPFFNSLKTQASRDQFRQEISERGVWGWFTVLGIQILQIVVAMIPGGPIEILAGVIYGTFGGLLVCLIGALIGTVLIFYAVRWLGRSLVTAFIDEKKLNQMKFLQNTQRLELITFVLFFIPGAPKDILTYIAGLTPIKPMRFFIISISARIPAIITSTYAGAALSEGKFWTFAIIYGIAAVIAAAGLIVNNAIMKKLNKDHGSTQNEQASFEATEEKKQP